MIKPIDILVNFNAIPEFARQTSAELAGLSYRQVSEHDRARQESLLRQERVAETVARGEAAFHGVEPKQSERTQATAAERELARQRRSKNRRMGELYGDTASYYRKRSQSDLGLELDFTA